MAEENEQKVWKFNLEKAQTKSTEVAMKDPLGYKSKTDDVIVRTSQHTNSNMTYTEVLEAKAWAVAKSPSGQFMQVIMMSYMSGSTVSIFSLMITIQFFTNPLKAIAGVNGTFTPFEHKDVNLMLPKLAFIGINLALMAMAVYKFSSLGVIPVTPNDWSGIVSTRVSS